MIEVSQHLTALIITEGPMSCPRSYPEHRPTITVEYFAPTLSRWGLLPRHPPVPPQAGAAPTAPNRHGPLGTQCPLPAAGQADDVGDPLPHRDRPDQPHRPHPGGRGRPGPTPGPGPLPLQRHPLRPARQGHRLARQATGPHPPGGSRRAGPVRPGHDDRRPGPVGQIHRGPQTAGGDPGLQPETPRAGLLPLGRGVRLRAGRLAAVVRRRHLGPGRGEDRPGGPAAADAPLSLLRLDGGCLAAKGLNRLTSQHVGCLTKAGTKLVSVRTLLGRTRAEPWQSSAEDTRLCRWNRVPLLDDFRTPVTVVLVECRRRVKKREQGRVCWKTRVFHCAIVTDQHHWPTAKVYETYKARWAVENFFKESNQSFSSGKVPSGKFHGNQFFLGLLVVVYNLMQFFKRDCLPRVYRAVSFATVRRHFLEHAVVIEERSEVEIHLVFNADYPMQREANLMLRKVLAA